MRRSHLMVCLALSVIACSDDDEVKPVPEPVVDAATPSPDAAAPTSDAAPVQARAIPLVDWVDDLIDHHTNDLSLPDSVDDKNIVDDQDPSTFDRRF